MHKTKQEAEQFIEAVRDVKTKDHTEVIVCAPFIHLSTLVEKAQQTNVKIAAQNVHFEEEGAFTGEVSARMLKDIGVTHVIIGHSERRQYFNETDESVNKKVITAFNHGLTPIICVGETLEQREENETLAHTENQVNIALNDLTDE